MKKVLGVLAAISLMIAGAVSASAATEVKAYAVSLVPDYSTTALLSAGDRVPETGNESSEFQMVGIPDGLGLSQSDSSALYMNHEFSNDKSSERRIGQPLERGAVISRWTLDGGDNVLTGERAYDTVYQEDELVGPAPDTDNSTPAFSRFCSGSLAGAAEGFTQDIFLSGEESDGADTFDGQGGQTVAVFDNELHALPAMGHFSKENTLIMPGTGDLTVAMVLEDGPAGPHSQLYMYVGEKDSDSDSVLAQNGLTGGSLYTFVSNDSNKTNEATFTAGKLRGRWAEIPNAAELDAAELDLATNTLGALDFVRIEDGAFSKTSRSTFFFDTTGGSAPDGNELGRLYSISINPKKPTTTSTLQVLYNADEIIDAGGDIAISPDNLDVSEDFLMIQEDGTAQSRVVMGEKERDGSIWRLPLMGNGSMVDLGGALRIVELDPPGRNETDPAVGPGVWETSGIIDASALFGPNTWLFDVQAHPPTTAPASGTVEDGQLLVLRP